jgi:hypothetical protein
MKTQDIRSELHLDKISAKTDSQCNESVNDVRSILSLPETNNDDNTVLLPDST